jgi:hypothetical protein
MDFMKMQTAIFKLPFAVEHIYFDDINVVLQDAQGNFLRGKLDLSTVQLSLGGTQFTAFVPMPPCILVQ